MPVPSAITDLSTTPGDNSPPGTESAKGNVDNYLRQGFAFTRQLYDATVAPAEVIIASASSVAIGAAVSSNIVISGTTTVTSFDTVAAGIVRNVRYSGAVPVTHNAISMILLGGASRTHVAGDCASFISLGSGNWKEIKFSPLGALPIANGGTGGVTASAARTALGATATGDAVFIAATAAAARTALGMTNAVLQVVSATYSTDTSVSIAVAADSGLTATITPSSTSSKILVLVSQPIRLIRGADDHAGIVNLVRTVGGVPTVVLGDSSTTNNLVMGVATATLRMGVRWSISALDSPATISACAYKTQGYPVSAADSGALTFQAGGGQSSIILMEIAG